MVEILLQALPYPIQGIIDIPRKHVSMRGAIPNSPSVSAAPYSTLSGRMTVSLASHACVQGFFPVPA